MRSYFFRHRCIKFAIEGWRVLYNGVYFCGIRRHIPAAEEQVRIESGYFTNYLQHFYTQFVALLLKFDFPNLISEQEVCYMAEKENYVIRVEGKLVEVSPEVY